MSGRHPAGGQRRPNVPARDDVDDGPRELASETDLSEHSNDDLDDQGLLAANENNPFDKIKNLAPDPADLPLENPERKTNSPNVMSSSRTRAAPFAGIKKIFVPNRQTNPENSRLNASFTSDASRRSNPGAKEPETLAKIFTTLRQNQAQQSNLGFRSTDSMMSNPNATNDRPRTSFVNDFNGAPGDRSFMFSSTLRNDANNRSKSRGNNARFSSFADASPPVNQFQSPSQRFARTSAEFKNTPAFNLLLQSQKQKKENDPMNKAMNQGARGSFASIGRPDGPRNKVATRSLEITDEKMKQLMSQYHSSVDSSASLNLNRGRLSAQQPGVSQSSASLRPQAPPRIHNSANQHQSHRFSSAIAAGSFRARMNNNLTLRGTVRPQDEKDGDPETNPEFADLHEIARQSMSFRDVRASNFATNQFRRSILVSPSDLQGTRLSTTSAFGNNRNSVAVNGVLNEVNKRRKEQEEVLNKLYRSRQFRKEEKEMRGRTSANIRASARISLSPMIAQRMYELGELDEENQKLLVEEQEVKVRMGVCGATEYYADRGCGVCLDCIDLIPFDVKIVAAILVLSGALAYVVFFFTDSYNNDILSLK